MRAVAVSVFAVLSAAGLVAARAGPDVHIARSVRSLARRADAATPGSSQYLSEIFAMETAQCNSTCSVSLSDFDGCSKLSDQASIAACACSALTLGDLRSCASCISTTTKSNSNETAVVSSYNSFVNLCLQEGLATVTGTVEVGVSTKPISRSSTAAVSSASSATRSAASSSLDAPSTVTSAPLATYNPSASYTSTATVPSLVASGSIASSARAAAASASTGNEKTSGAQLDGSVRMAVVAFAAVAGGAVLLA